MKTWENQFRVPKVFGPLWGPQLKLQTRKVSHKFYKTVCFRFENLSARIWNIFLNLHFKFAPSGLFTVWNVILSELFDQRQTFCLQFSCAAASRQRMFSRLSLHSAAGSFPLVLVSFVLPVFRSICLAVQQLHLRIVISRSERTVTYPMTLLKPMTHPRAGLRCGIPSVRSRIYMAGLARAFPF